MSQVQSISFTQKQVLDWAGNRVFREGRALFESGAVGRVTYEHPDVEGTIAFGNRSLTSKFRLLRDGSVENRCPCRDSTERGIICCHVVAVALKLIRRYHDPDRERKEREERRQAARLARIREDAFIKRARRGTAGTEPADLKLMLEGPWKKQAPDRFPLKAYLQTADREWPLGDAPTDVPFGFSEQDEGVLFVLEDIHEGPAPSRMELDAADFLNILEVRRGGVLHRANGKNPCTVNAAVMQSEIRMDLDEESGELVLNLHTELPFRENGNMPLYMIAGKKGWVYEAGHFWPLDQVLPGPLQAIYGAPITVGRSSVPQFINTELGLIQAHLPVRTEISDDLFTVEPATPRFRLLLKGSPASLAPVLYADYDEVALVAGKADAAGHFALPDPADLMRYLVRNPDAEAQALQDLERFGLSASQGDELPSVVGTRDVLNFLGTALPRLRRMGWRVEMEGRIEPYMEEMDFVTPVVHVEEGGGSGWFEVGFDYEHSGGGGISEQEIQRALLKGESYVERGGKTLLLDADAIETAREVFADCAGGEGRRPGTFRVDGIYSGYVKSSLDSLDGIDVEAGENWMSRARVQNRSAKVQPVALGATMETSLRPYQKEGVYWMRFLEESGFCGILADEMGLGKTLQTLAWIELPRIREEAQKKPVLIVCPTSLVENWLEEAARWTPGLRVLVLSGSSRHDRWEEIAQSDIVITSYALIRRDIELYDDLEFAAAILDEAQHIKNRSTQNAVAAKRLRAMHRFVLTGTPVENGVSDMWSIMDFLMPGYLGAHATFKEHYEQPVSAGGPDAEAAHRKLRRKLHPFLMRRMKRDVAKDLPPKIERIAACTLTRDQQAVYKQLVQTSRRKIEGMVAKQGFNRSRMEILKILMRLRQTCCHLDLLKLENVESKNPSAKMDLFFELLNEALDGEHRVLVFSQFTSMLKILRQELEDRSLRYCYLDGSTKDRLSMVREFNTNREIPVFLMSLKAGGVGLNLTGADMVIHYDPWWNPAVEDQATDRAYRIGQKRTVYSVKLITRGTVEDKVLELQKKKKQIIDATLEQDEKVLSKLNWEDIQDLLTL